MTNEEAISIMKVIVHMLEEKYDTDRVEEAVDMAIKALSSPKKLNRWIPISERLPEVRYDACGNVMSNEVIIWLEKDSIGGEYEWYDVGFFNPRNMCFEVISREDGWETICHISKVKAWMPLPKPYKAKGGKR